MESKQSNNPELSGSQTSDYYFEDGKLVFTSHYHLKRGYCCRSGCRHCPFGFNSKTSMAPREFPEDQNDMQGTLNIQKTNPTND